MPSERSLASAITGLKAAREKAKSISLQTWTRPFSMTARVMGSRVKAGSGTPAASRRAAASRAGTSFWTTSQITAKSTL